jgi:hypothetical protein
MKWLYVTLVLLTSSVCLVGWIYLRDRDTSSYLPPQPSERQRALADSSTTLVVLNEGDCHSHCRIELLGHTQPDHWLVRINVKGRSHCLQIDLDTFLVSQKHGFSGVQSLQPSRCDLHPASKAKT